MTSHELAKLLLEHPDLPVATHALNFTNVPDRWNGAINVGIMETPNREQWIIIGDFSRKKINYPNEYIVQVLASKHPIPEDWPRYNEDVVRTLIEDTPPLWPPR